MGHVCDCSEGRGPRKRLRSLCPPWAKNSPEGRLPVIAPDERGRWEFQIQCFPHFVIHSFTHSSQPETFLHSFRIWALSLHTQRAGQTPSLGRVLKPRVAWPGSQVTGRGLSALSVKVLPSCPSSQSRPSDPAQVCQVCWQGARITALGLPACLSVSRALAQRLQALGAMMAQYWGVPGKGRHAQSPGVLVCPLGMCGVGAGGRRAAPQREGRRGRAFPGVSSY